MAKDAQEKTESPACGCGGGSCGGGGRKWIWLLLGVAVAGVLTVKQIGRGAAEPAVPSDSKASAVATPPASLPRLVDLGSTRCLPCKMMAPILDDLKKTYAGQLEVQFIDVWDVPAAGKHYNIGIIPTQIFYDASGKERFRHEGFFEKEEILAKWKELGVELSGGSPPGAAAAENGR